MDKGNLIKSGEQKMVKKASIKDVALLSGVSITTVSQIINGKGHRFSKATIDKVLQARDELGYVPNHAARSLKSKTTILIGVIVPSFRLPFFADLIQSMETHAPSSVRMVFLSSPDNHLENTIHSLVERGVDALIFGRQFPNDKAIAQLLSKQNIPYLVLDQNNNEAARDKIIVDEFQGGSLVADHFVTLGHQKIAMVLPEMLTQNMLERQDGFLATLQKYDVNPIILTAEKLSKHGGFRMSQSVIDSQVTAVFAFNDEMAMGLMRGLVNLGMTIPGDISIAGYDDADYAEFFIPTLTTVTQPVFEIGSAVLSLILNRLKFPQSPPQIQKFQLKLVARESTRKI